MSDPSLLSVTELQQRLNAEQPLTLLDVREDKEVTLCALPGSLHIPLGQIPLRFAEIPTGQPLVAYCHHGARSQRAIDYLRTQGFENMHNLTGGIHVWATIVDPTMPTY